MTNEEAIKDIKENLLPIVGGESLLMAIEALKKAPTALDHIHNVVRDDGIAVHEAIELLKKAETNCPEIPDSWIPVTKKMPKYRTIEIKYGSRYPFLLVWNRWINAYVRRELIFNCR